VTVITDDGSCIQSAAVMLEALKKAKENGLRVIEHCEDCDVCAGGAIHYGAISEQLGVPGQRRAVEELIVARDIVLADEIGWGVHIQHISTKGSVEMVRDAQARGLPITAEASPHHLALTDRAVLEHGPNAKMNPPLRDETDRKAVIQGLRQGTIQSIATDHAPHAPDEKSNPLTKAPAGILGFETAFPVCNAELVGKGHLGLSQLIAALTSGPRQILGLEAGTLSVGARADVLVLDPRAEHVVNAATSYSKSRNTPFDGQKLKGQVLLTLVDGEAIYSQLAELPGKI
jgi:dihydroorotase